MKLLFFDCETTGLNPATCAIIQLAGKIVIDGETKATFNYFIKPHEGAEISDEALAIHGLTRAIISLHPSAQSVHETFVLLLGKFVDKYNKADKFYLVGFNSRAFDEPFLRAWWSRIDTYYGSYFWQVGLDVMVLALEHLKHALPAMLNFKLPTLAAEMGVAVDVNKLHDAAYDVDLTHAIYQRLQNPIDATHLARKVLSALDQQQRYFLAARTGDAGKGEALTKSRQLEAELKELCLEIIKPDCQQQKMF